MFRRSSSLIAAASIAVGVVVTLGLSSAQGAGPKAPPHGPPPPPPCAPFVYNGAAQAPKKGCVETGPAPLWSPPVGAVDSSGRVVKPGDQIVGPSTCCGFAAYTFHGQSLTAATVDFLRLPDGRVRLFLPDINQVQTGKPSTVAMDASSRLGVQAISGEIEVAPAPLWQFPLRAGDNSLSS